MPLSSPRAPSPEVRPVARSRHETSSCCGASCACKARASDDPGASPAPGEDSRPATVSSALPHIARGSSGSTDSLIAARRSRALLLPFSTSMVTASSVVCPSASITVKV